MRLQKQGPYQIELCGLCTLGSLTAEGAMEQEESPGSKDPVVAVAKPQPLMDLVIVRTMDTAVKPSWPWNRSEGKSGTSIKAGGFFRWILVPGSFLDQEESAEPKVRGKPVWWK